MCIISYVPSGKTISEETIKIMFKGNPDGAGIMWKPTFKSAVQIKKGFMKVEDLIKAFNEIPTECERAIHCRIATAGKVSVACCHPFPVRPKVSAMRLSEDTAEIALMHNGVISYANPVLGLKADYSDSMNFAAKYLYPLRHQLDKEYVQTLIEESTPSRLLIMREGADTIMLGNWKYEGGVYYSNGNYKPYVASKKYKGYGYNIYSGYYDDCRSIYGDYGYDGVTSLNSDEPSEEPCYESVVLDIVGTDYKVAKQKVEEVLDSYEDIEYEVYKSSLPGELEIEVVGLPDNITSIAGFKVSERTAY